MPLIDTVLDLAANGEADLPAHALALARLSLFDWLTCGRAGRDEPLAVALRGLAAAEEGRAEASVFAGPRVPARMAALVNGATSHALDYDDTHFAHIGHPSVAIYPAALALAEARDRPATEAVAAFLVGAEASIRIGLALGAGHYDRGFHQTATAGAFGATVAAGRLLALSRPAMRAAIGLCATRASGLKSQFGTMGKPYNAGIAAANGVECALLAAAGFTSCDDGLAGPQGFLATHADAPDIAAALAAARDAAETGRFLFEDVKYKLHACCQGTHAMIEALAALRRERGLAPGDVATLHLRTSPRWLSVCDIKHPRTGLEVKFSYAWLAGMVLSGIDTARDATYRDTLARDSDLVAFAARVSVAGDAALSDMQAVCEVVLVSGERIEARHDLAAPLDPAVLQAALAAKARALLGARTAAMLEDLMNRIDGASAGEIGAAMTQEAER